MSFWDTLVLCFQLFQVLIILGIFFLCACIPVIIIGIIGSLFERPKTYLLEPISLKINENKKRTRRMKIHDK